MTIPLTAYLVVGAILFAIGVYTVIAQRAAVMILMGIEVLLNAIGLNIIAFWRFTAPTDYSAQIFAILTITVGAAERALGLALMLLLSRRRRTVEVDSYAELKRCSCLSPSRPCRFSPPWPLSASVAACLMAAAS